MPEDTSPACEVSVVIPIFNEGAIVRDSVAGLLDRLPDITNSFEIILAENGSTDDTLERARELAERHSFVSVIHVEEPNYGRALRQGILSARGAYLICDEIDLCDTDFYRSSLGLMRAGKAQMVVGSKLAPGAQDDRPWLRHLASQVFSGLLKLAAGFQGTDTHGLKAFVRKDLQAVVKACELEKNLFASELVIRAERMGLDIVELPLCVREKRKPSINLVRRVPGALADMGKLAFAIRFGRERTK